MQTVSTIDLQTWHFKDLARCAKLVCNAPITGHIGETSRQSENRATAAQRIAQVRSWQLPRAHAGV
jgi:hypothetical protein